MLRVLYPNKQLEVVGGFVVGHARGAMEHLYIADTNLFFEAKRLEDLPWAELGVDPIVIGLTKPVQAEIDRHKKGTGRTRKRALETFGRVRAMLQKRQTENVIREAAPRVVLRLMTHAHPDPKYADTLDYDAVDDRIVGIVSELSKDESFASVKVMTDDGGVGMTATAIGVNFHLLEDSWKREAVMSDKDRQIADLKKDIAAYRSQEPIIQVEDATDAEISPHVVRKVPDALSPDQVDELVKRLEATHPKVTDFSVPETRIESDGAEISYIAPSDEDVSDYTTTEYQKWLSQCRSDLERLHEGREEREPSVTIRVSLRNVGARPASKLRISFEAQGQLFIIRRSREIDVEHDQPTHNPAVTRLSIPPVAPKAERVVKRPPKPQSARSTDIAELSRSMGGSVDLANLGFARPGSVLDAAARAGSVFDDLHRSGVFDDLTRGSSAIQQALGLQAEHQRMQDLINPSHLNMLTGPDHRVFMDPIVPRLPIIPKHDPEDFYYDDWPEGRPVRTGVLTCDLFRHQGEAEFFDVEIAFPEEGDITGAVLCRVEAENLTKPVETRIRVGRTVEHFAVLNVAQDLIEALGN